MNFLLVPLLVPLFFFLPGYLFSRILFRTPTLFSVGERWFLPIAISVCLTTWLSLTLAEIGAFSLLNVALLLLLVCVPLGFFARNRLTAWTLWSSRPDWVFIALMALAVLLYARPAEYFIGNSDAGTYINTGAHIARTGALALVDGTVAQLSPQAQKLFFWQLVNPYMLYKQARLPGFFIADPAQGIVLPQFLHLYPAWLALWDAMLGVQLGLYATPLIALLGTLAFYFLARELFGFKLARLVLFLLILTVPQFWFARYPVAEAMTQFMVLTGMYVLLKMMHPDLSDPRTRAGLGIVAGVAFGELFLVRSDSVLFLIPLGGYALALIFLRKWRLEHWAMFGAFGIVFFQAIVHIVVFAPTYFYFQYTHALRMQNIDKLLHIQLPEADALFSSGEYLLGLLGLLALGVVALFAADRIFQLARTRWGRKIKARLTGRAKYGRLAGAGVIVLVVVAFYLVLPHPGSLLAYVGGVTPTESTANLIKLGWYLSPIGIALATLGAVIVVLRDLTDRNAFFFGTAALFALVYFDELYSNPHYIYTTRHYIPLVIPLCILLAGRALQWLWQKAGLGRESSQSGTRLRALGKLAAGAAFFLWMLYNLYVMGVVDPCGAQRCSPNGGNSIANLESVRGAAGPVIRLPFVSETFQLGPFRIQPFQQSIAGTAELGGTFSQLQALADALDPNAIVILSGNNRDEPALLATPLRYIFGRDALVVVADAPDGEELAKQVDAWRADGRDVIFGFGTNGGRFTLPHYALEPLGIFGLDVPQWTFAYDVLPRVPWRLNVNYGLFRAVPRQAPEPTPFVLNFGGDDYPYLVRGFLERSPEAQSRWIGGLLSDDAKLGAAEWISAAVRVPVQVDRSRDVKLTLRARAPHEGVRLDIRHNTRTLGSLTLSPTLQEYSLSIPATEIVSAGDVILIEFAAQPTPDGEGRVLGAELEQLIVQQEE